MTNGTVPMNESTSAQVLDTLLAAAIRAPSMHNAQPWLFAARGSTIAVYRDPDRALPAEDPDGRGAHIGCGAALFNLRVAAAHVGRRTTVEPLPDPSDPLFLARMTLHEEGSAPEPLGHLYAAIERRRTDRRPYTARPVPSDLRSVLAAAAEAESTRLEWIEDRDRLRHTLELTADATLEDQYAEPRWRERLRWVGGSRLTDGIPGELLTERAVQYAAPVRDFFAGYPRRPHGYARYEDLPQLVIFWTPDDGPLAWLRAGQACERVLLEATRLGLASSFLDQALEYADTRRLLREPVHGTGHPQEILRLGYVDDHPTAARSPRRPVREVLIEPPPT